MIDYKVEKISDNKAIIHRRILTPWFQLKLKPLSVEYIEYKVKPQFVDAGLASFTFPPYGTQLCVGRWKGAKARYLKALDSIKEEYSRMERG